METFRPDGLMEPALQEGEPTVTTPFGGEFVATNVNLREEADSSFVSGTSFRVPVTSKIGHRWARW